MKDPYQTLGVAKTATQDEIKTAYRNLAKKAHPDLNPGNKVAEEKFKNLSIAYELIGTKDARAKFDRGETLGQQQENAQRHARENSQFYNQTQQDQGRYSYSFGQGMGDEDIFENLFRSANQSRSGGRHKAGGAAFDYPGEDQFYQMSVEFKDAILGAEREITLPTGKRLKVKIPPGVETGSKLRFKNQGGPGIGKGASGDAFVEITVNPLEGFSRTGQDIETEIPISFIEALLGAEIKAPTLQGAVMLKVPPGVNSGSRLRIKGKGVALPGTPGDQIVILKIVMPKKADPALTDAIKNWDGKYSYNPREEL